VRVDECGVSLSNRCEIRFWIVEEE